MIRPPMRLLSRRGAFLLVLSLSFCLPARGQDEGAEPADDDGSAEKGEDEVEDEAEDEGAETWFAILGGDVYTGTGAVLRDTTVLARNGRIVEIGHDVRVPEGARTVDARGLRVYPGLVALQATNRITEGETFADPDAGRFVDPPRDDVEVMTGDPLHPDDEGGVHVDGEGEEHERHGEDAETPDPAASDLRDSFDPFSDEMLLALSAGITTVQQGDAAIKLRRGELADVVLAEKRLTNVSWSLRNPSGIATTREKFQKAAAWLRAYRRFEASSSDDKSRKEPSKKGVDMDYVDVLRGVTLARFSVDEREELVGVARLAQEYDFRPVIFGCVEGWTIADELGRSGAFAVVTPREREPKVENLIRPGGSSIENAALLHERGTQVAIIPNPTSFVLNGLTGTDLLHFPIEAAFAVRGGLSEPAALAAITIVPARILGVAHRVGTLEVGKDCDLILTDGDLLHYETFVQVAVVSGAVVYDKAREILFAHIRPLPTSPTQADEAENAPEVEAPDERAEAERANGSEDEGAGEDGENEDE